VNNNRTISFLLAGIGIYFLFGRKAYSGNTALAHPDGRILTITPESREWMARMVDAETWGNATTADVDHMVWALLNRRSLWKFWGWDWKRYISAYSQPINPIWRMDGSRCRQYYPNGQLSDGSELPKSHACSPHRVAKREENATKPMSEISPMVIQRVNDILDGRIDNPIPGVVGWIAQAVWDRGESSGRNRRNNMVYSHSVGGNAYHKMFRDPPMVGIVDLSSGSV